MSRAYELFYANHSLESKMEPCALCFQACSDKIPKKNLPVSAFRGIRRLFFCSSFLSVCVWSGGWKGAAVHSKQLKKRPQNFGIQNDVNSPPKPLHMCYKSVWEQNCKKKKNRSWAECNDSAFFFLFLVALHMNPQGTTFSELNICTCFTSPVFSHSSSCLTTAPLLFSHPLRLDRPGEYEREERGERMVSRRFTTLWICHFEDEVYECI